MTEPHWMVRAGDGGVYTDEFAFKQVVAIGWDKLGDLSGIPPG